MCVADAVDTACSSSLVTTHLAAKALMSGEVAAAATMGVNLTLVQSWTRACLRAGMLSEEGRCAFCFLSFLKHLHNAETRFYCPQAFLILDVQCKDNVCELKYTHIGIGKAFCTLQPGVWSQL